MIVMANNQIQNQRGQRRHLRLVQNAPVAGGGGDRGKKPYKRWRKYLLPAGIVSVMAASSILAITVGVNRKLDKIDKSLGEVAGSLDNLDNSTTNLQDSVDELGNSATQMGESVRETASSIRDGISEPTRGSDGEPGADNPPGKPEGDVNPDKKASAKLDRLMRRINWGLGEIERRMKENGEWVEEKGKTKKGSPNRNSEAGQ
jgi:uncharacterized phage infection (PIP) family protein YhgE